MGYSSIEKRLAQIPDPEEEDNECPFILSPRDDLLSELSRRRLGPAGQKLYRWLEHGGDLTPELEELLRKVCLKVPAMVWSPKDGCLIDQGHLDPDEIIGSMPRELAEERQYEEALKIGLLSGPPAGADSPLPFETAPGETEEDI
jgi:hypothetical protein